MFIELSDVLWVLGVFVVAMFFSGLIRVTTERAEKGFTYEERVRLLGVILAVLITLLVAVVRWFVL